MNAAERGLRLAIVSAAKRLAELGMNPGKAGNVSARVEAGFLITPSGKSYSHLGAEDLVRVDADGRLPEPGAPSTEWRLHRDLYARRAEAKAIVHTHSPYATTLACLRRAIPAFHYEVAFAGGRDIRCSGYATFGTQELSDLALGALEGRRACLMANHGVVAFGADVESATALAEKVEALAQLYWQAIQSGEPVLLDDAEMARVVEKFATYGRR
jgi:L-fuculose-phosphate aldolase